MKKVTILKSTAGTGEWEQMFSSPLLPQFPGLMNIQPTAGVYKSYTISVTGKGSGDVQVKLGNAVVYEDGVTNCNLLLKIDVTSKKVAVFSGGEEVQPAAVHEFAETDKLVVLAQAAKDAMTFGELRIEESKEAIEL